MKKIPNKYQQKTAKNTAGEMIGVRARKSLGQNFLTSKAITRDIIEASGISVKDTVLEIGPGKGFLTKELLKKAGKVIAIEKDRRLIEHLQEKFAEEVSNKKLVVIHGDILDFSAEQLKHTLKSKRYTLVANIPYYITGQILRMFLESDMQPQKMVLMVQKEVAQRVVARDGKESILSISVKAYGTPRYVKKVPARYFSPQPKVDSAILLIDKISKKLFKNKKAEGEFFELMKMGFAHKRKTLSNNLKSYRNTKEAFKNCEIPQKIRAEKLTLKDWLCLIKYYK
jgi:16S rRNA (adenine1518-N6/adenine1519-N6)-dimethyltransferase